MSSVELSVYDLSMGMARTLSGQILGHSHEIPIIPHTGVIVYGREYFFSSSGIQNMDPIQFRQSHTIQPVQIMSLGTTNVTKEEFERWCYSGEARTLYNEYSYDLLTRNCNNFSDYVIRNGLRVSQEGVPRWILDVPQKVMSSPMGQMMMPMLNGMQAPFSGNHNPGNYSGARNNPFASNATNNTATISTTNLTPSNRSTATEVNPWADLSPVTSTEIENSTSIKEHKHGSNDISTPFLDKNCTLLLSDDNATVSICIKKLLALSQKQQKVCQDTSPADTSHLLKLQTELSSDPTSIDSETVFKALYHHINSDSNWALMLLRLIVLYPPSNKDANNGSMVLSNLLMILVRKITTPASTLSPTARSIIWLVLSNTMKNPNLLLGNLHEFKNSSSNLSLNKLHFAGDNESQTNLNMETLVDSAIQDLLTTNQKPELKQATSAFLFNTVHVFTSLIVPNNDVSIIQEIPDWAITILCSSLEEISQEKEDVTKFRRLIVAAKLVKTFRSAGMASLLKDLGFFEVLSDEYRNIELNANGSQNNISSVMKELVEELLVVS